jgi:3-hydroxyisobutyrate dehydrogenase-like beta-hydroxyacid dehydrogenase
VTASYQRPILPSYLCILNLMDTDTEFRCDDVTRGMREDSKMTTIGFLGAGQLGEPMVHRLLGAGHHVLVFARREDVRTRLRNAGAALAESAAEVAANSDIVISCLFSDAQLREIGLGPAGFIAHARPGSVVVSHTTGSSATLAELTQGASVQVTILDAPVSGTAEHIAKGELTVLIGGLADAVERVKPVLAAYANPIVATGDLGSALSIKLLNNMLFAANTQLVATVTAVGERLGVRPAALLQALSVCSGGSNAATYALGMGGMKQFEAAVGPFLRKDVAAAAADAEAAGVDLGLLRWVIEHGPMALTAATGTHAGGQ